MNCFGTYTAASGNKYVGEFGSDGFHGQGTYTYTSGDKYVGEFRNSQFHGQGTYTYANGRIKEGIWEADELKYARPSPATLRKKRRDKYRAALTKCLFDNVEKVINQYAKRIVEAECRRKIKK